MNDMILSSLLCFEWFAVNLYFMYGAYLNTRNKKNVYILLRLY